MEMRQMINLLESATLARPETPADRFIAAAYHSVKSTYGDIPGFRLEKIGTSAVDVTDDMQGTRTARSWAILRMLKTIADKYDIRMNIQGASGQHRRMMYR